MAEDDGGDDDDDDELPCVDHDPLNEGAVGKMSITILVNLTITKMLHTNYSARASAAKVALGHILKFHHRLQVSAHPTYRYKILLRCCRHVCVNFFWILLKMSHRVPALQKSKHPLSLGKNIHFYLK